MSKLTNKLTLKQEKFCNLYVELGNASDAYRGSYSCGNMKDETINNKAYQMLKREDIRARVAVLQAEIKNRMDYRKEDALRELINIANSNIMDFIDVNSKDNIKLDSEGNVVDEVTVQRVFVKDLSSLTKEQQKCIKSIQPTRGGDLRLELYSKVDAIDRIAKMLGLNEAEKTSLEVTSKLTDKELEEQINNLRENLNE